MATIAVIDHNFSTTGGTRINVFTPAVNGLLVVVTAHTGNTSDAAPTDNNPDGLGTYTAVETRVKNSSADKIKLWIRDALIGSATSTTVTHAPGTSSGGGLATFIVTGMTKVGAAAKAKSGGQDNQSNGTPTVTWTGGGSANTNNPCVGVVFNAANPATVTKPTAFDTEEFSLGYGTPATGVRAASVDSGFTGSTVTWGSSSSSAFASVALELDASSGAALVKAATDDLELDDQIQRNLILSRFSSDDLELTDSNFRNLTLARLFTDNLELTDSTNRSLTLQRNVLDILELTDLTPHLKTMPRSVVDDLELIDSDLKTLGFIRSMTDELELTDSDVSFLGKTRFVTDDLSLTDSALRLMEMVRVVINSLAFDDITARSISLVRTSIDQLNLTDLPRRSINLIRAVVDDLDLSDSTHKVVGFVRSVVDDLELTDLAQKVIGFVRSVIDEIEFVDTIQKVVNAVGEGAARIIQRGIKWFRYGGTG